MWKKQNWPNEKWCFRAENFVEPRCDVCTFEICHRFNSSITIVVIIIIMIIMIIIIIIIYYNIIILYNIILSVKFWSDLKMWTLVSHSVEPPKKIVYHLNFSKIWQRFPALNWKRSILLLQKSGNLRCEPLSVFTYSESWWEPAQYCYWKSYENSQIMIKM